jgi:hypothetical protein
MMEADFESDYMNPDWKNVLSRLRTYSEEVNTILPPCPEERLYAVEADLGKMPDVLRDMLRHFNGAKLFLRGLPLVRVFGISTIPPLPALEWGPDWYVDKYTPTWRRASPGRENQWAIGMTNYGGLIILDKSGITKQWDTSQEIWEPNEWSFDEWIEGVLREGDAFMKED